MGFGYEVAAASLMVALKGSEASGGATNGRLSSDSPLVPLCRRSNTGANVRHALGGL
jgi:hypothetical protein